MTFSNKQTSLILGYLASVGTLSFSYVLSRLIGYSVSIKFVCAFSFAVGLLACLIGWLGLCVYLDRWFGRLWKYLAVGYANTGLDFLVLNLLLSLTNSRVGWLVGLCNLVSFSIATIHSYPWMRGWVFCSPGRPNRREIASFISVTIFGALVSSLILVGGTILFSKILVIPPSLLLVNSIKAVAVSTWIALNFLGYRRFTFIRKPDV